VSHEVGPGTTELPAEPQVSGGFLGGLPSGDWNVSQQLNRIEGKIDWLAQALVTVAHSTNKVLGQELSISKKENQIMAAVQVEQEDIDAVASGLESLVTEVDNIDTSQVPAGTLDGLKQAAADLASAVNSKLPVTDPVTPPAS
jgi:methyl-accepting chemotaxis protein